MLKGFRRNFLLKGNIKKKKKSLLSTRGTFLNLTPDSEHLRFKASDNFKILQKSKLFS